MGRGALPPEVGTRVWEALWRAGYTATSAAAALQVSKGTVYAWQRGNAIHRTGLLAVAALLDVDPHELETGEARPSQPIDQVASVPATKRSRVMDAISDGLDDDTIETLARYKPETIRLVMAGALDHFATGITVGGRRGKS